MLKLLIVDDETYTREGIIDALPWSDLGINEIRQAFDGVNALELINDYKPNIILTDIKMPRMNGIDLAINIRKLLPACAIIFMSSYSDKVYLKSAIQLKAVNYVEKPLDLDELYNSILNASNEISKTNNIKENLENTVALQLLVENDSSSIEKIINNCFSIDMINSFNGSTFITIIAKNYNDFPENKTMIINSIRNLCALYEFSSLISVKDDNSIIMHLFVNKDIFQKIKSTNLPLLLKRLSEYLGNFSNHYLCVGLSVDSIFNVFNSYNDAKKLLNYIFYHEYNSVIYNNLNLLSNIFFEEINYSFFEETLKLKDKNKLFTYTQQLLKNYKTSYNISPSYIRDVYYNLTIRVINFSKSRDVNLEMNYQSNSILNDILSFNNIFELHNFLWSTIDKLFLSLSKESTSEEPIHKVMKYINENYSNSNLSLDEISRNTFLNSSYICVIFKEFTGTTVNKYIHELRINKAKTLLQNPNIKMKDIASKTGYSDGNYFTKIFKKDTGYNPSEYRRKFAK